MRQGYGTNERNGDWKIVGGTAILPYDGTKRSKRECFRLLPPTVGDSFIMFLILVQYFSPVIISFVNVSCSFINNGNADVSRVYDRWFQVGCGRKYCLIGVFITNRGWFH